ncbi:MAG: methionine--tRNA ligase subunit beta, partial [Muribaculaceae bacterium]|nr:methionine--tRNA ligase subunit beta [Muribaculaceae bacterium]
IPVPVEGAEGKVLYVWFDAPIGYISNTIDADPQGWEKWWKDPETRMLHFIGKDNIVFHCIVFPAMLMAHGGYNLPDNVPANEFLNLEDQKISTSRNWAVWLHEYLRELPGKQDVLRYVLTANAPEAKDNNFTWKDFQARNNNELVAILGNFVNRALVLTHKYFDGTVPPQGELQEADKQLIEQIRSLKTELTEAIETFHFREALRVAMDMARAGNKYLQETEPWKLAKTDMERTATILNLAVQTCANLAIAFEPFMPFMAEKLLKMLNGDKISWDMIGCFDLVPAGAKIATPELLFEKIEDSVVEAQVQKLKDAEKQNLLDAWKPAEVKSEVDFPTFERLDIRVGKVLECKKVPKADKLLQFKIDDGMGGRTIVSGIAKFYDPADLVGKEVCFIANFPPRKLKGVVSQGMILSAEDADGRLVVIGPTGEVRPGCSVG